MPFLKIEYFIGNAILFDLCKNPSLTNCVKELKKINTSLQFWSDEKTTTSRIIAHSIRTNRDSSIS